MLRATYMNHYLTPFQLIPPQDEFEVFCVCPTAKNQGPKIKTKQPKNIIRPIVSKRNFPSVEHMIRKPRACPASGVIVFVSSALHDMCLVAKSRPVFRPCNIRLTASIRIAFDPPARLFGVPPHPARIITRCNEAWRSTSVPISTFTPYSDDRPQT